MEEAQKAHFDSQPFFLVTDDAYERMLNELLKGAPFVKTYINVCPHVGTGSDLKTMQSNCNCFFNKNVLNADKKIVRTFGNESKPVYSSSMFMNLYGKG